MGLTVPRPDRGANLLLGRRSRLVLGFAISAFFVAATLARVDLDEAGTALARVDPRGLLLAVGLVGIELVVRAFRWKRFLAPLADVPLRLTTGYLAIGYLANSMLPARLGDLARAFLAGRAFGLPRVTVLGTVVVERLADGLFIVGVVGVLGLTLAGGATLAERAWWIGGLGLVGLAVLLVAVAWLRGSGGGRLRLWARELVDRLLRGADAVRTPAGFLGGAALTAVAFGIAVTMFSVVAGAAGIELTIAQSALAMGGLALSTAVPAAPGSIGTYEFVGVTVLSAFGIPPATALVTVVIVHLVVTLPLAFVGLVAAWQLHFRVSELADDAEPALLAAEPASDASVDPPAAVSADEPAPDAPGEPA
ncbi:MAG TPA: lysylphosphatidylglycerol synthase transmembrane domain-containing protein [Candidatus Limnocylindrales bacterium]|nr:lysylphosphatidylglycerol synthase transmembrane domain-containing protein [Candidatus Limnocylindrales bacterium]